MGLKEERFYNGKRQRLTASAALSEIILQADFELAITVLKTKCDEFMNVWG